MDYKYIKEIVRVEKENSTIISVAIERKDVGNITLISDYSIKFGCNKVVIKARKDGKIIESRTFLDTDLFPRHIERTRTQIKIYLESFKHEIKDV